MQLAKMMLRTESVIAPVESMKDENAGLKRLGINNLNEIALYNATTEELPIIIRAASNFVKNPNKVTLFHAPTFCNSVKRFQGKLRAAFVDQHTDSTLKCFEYLKKDMSRMRTTSIIPFQTFFSCRHLHRHNPTDRK